MDQLAAFAKKWSRQAPGFGGCWLGDIGGVRVSKRPREIALRAGFDPPADFQPPPVSDIVAARIISYGLYESLAYGKRRYREGEAHALVGALRELGASAEFWADQPHSDFADGIQRESDHGSSRLTGATFEVFVLGANASTGFIWWRTEED